jgi:hypothetical protein
MNEQAKRKDALLDAAIEFIGTLTGMKPPPIETAPPETFAPFRAFVEQIEAIVSGDRDRLDWLEGQAKSSRTGVSFDWAKHVQDGYVQEKGYRFMRFHHLGERKQTIREAIDSARALPQGAPHD